MSGKLSLIIDTVIDLQTQLSNIVAQQDVGKEKEEDRIVHFVKNPFATEIGKEEREYEQLKAENARLRARLALIEAGNNADITLRIDDAVNKAHRIETLSKKIAEYKTREKKISCTLEKAATEFRSACLFLVGYRVDALKDNIYRLSSKYAEGDEDKLFFQLKSDGTIILLNNEYAGRYNRFIKEYVQEADSFPAFLAAITLDLFKKSRMQSDDMSITMSTTAKVL